MSKITSNRDGKPTPGHHQLHKLGTVGDPTGCRYTELSIHLTLRQKGARSRQGNSSTHIQAPDLAQATMFNEDLE